MDNRQEPATKADLEVLEDKLTEAIHESEATLREMIRESEATLREVIRDTETKLLRAFYDFAESNQKRLTESERMGSVLVDRLATIERRLTEVEKRLHLPPAS